MTPPPGRPRAARPSAHAPEREPSDPDHDEIVADAERERGPPAC